MATNPLLITLADLPIHRQMKLCKTLCVHIHIPDKLTCFNLVLVWPSGSFLTRLWVDLIYHDNVMKIENQIFFQWEWGSRWTWTLITCLNQLMKSICLVGWLDVLMHFEIVKPRLCRPNWWQTYGAWFILLLPVPWHYNKFFFNIKFTC